MPYVETIMIGSNQVVTGFDPPTFDPVQSENIIRPLLEASDEYTELLAIRAELVANMQLQWQIRDQWKDYDENSTDWNDCQENFTAACCACDEIKKRYYRQDQIVNELHRSLYESDGVRFILAGTEQVDQATYDSLMQKLAELESGQRLLFDGTYIVDNIGTKYWTKPVDTWVETEITELGVQKPAVDAWLWDELSKTQVAEIEDQIDIARIATLTAEQKLEEKTVLLEEALVQAGAKRSQFEIQNTLDPLGEAQQWYADRCAWIENRYQ